MSIIGMPMILAPIFGPTLGGLILDHARLALDLLRQRARRDRRRRHGHAPAAERRGGRVRTKLDRVGLALLALGVPLFVYGLAEIGQSGGLAAPQA